MRVAAIDIGTNSMRLLITDGLVETVRLERVTGLGRGVDHTGTLSGTAVAETLTALAEFRAILDEQEVPRVRAIATSASRDASNREEFFDAVETVLGIRPELISGDQEARLAYAGATGEFDGTPPFVVSDIGGGSTEFVTAGQGVSVDIGSVRLTERAIPSRPAPWEQVAAARGLVREMFSGISLAPVGTLIGVAGTWTELPKLARGLPRETDTHGKTVTNDEVGEVVGMLAGLTLEETEALPSLNPKRASAILGGVLVAEGVMDVLGMDRAMASVHDSLDGVAAALLDGDGLP